MSTCVRMRTFQVAHGVWHRYILHYDLPKSFEGASMVRIHDCVAKEPDTGYYQETGSCLFLWCLDSDSKHIF